jgi:hypothetical protein
VIVHTYVPRIANRFWILIRWLTLHMPTCVLAHIGTYIFVFMYRQHYWSLTLCRHFLTRWYLPSGRKELATWTVVRSSEPAISKKTFLLKQISSLLSNLRFTSHLKKTCLCVLLLLFFPLNYFLGLLPFFKWLRGLIYLGLHWFLSLRRYIFR